MSSGFKLNKIYSAGYCVSSGIIADRTLSWKKVRFYTRCFLLEHREKGLILIDTGYGKDLIESTKRGVYSLYRALLPVFYSPEDSLKLQLAKDGVSLKDLSYLVITHYHPDHIGALPEFANVPWIYRSDTLNQLMGFSKLKGLKHGFIRPLVPQVPARSIAITEKCFNKEWNSFSSIDLFGDGSFHLIDLPGHALGQMGVATQSAFFAADAKWSASTLPHPIGFLLQENSKVYRKTFESLQNVPVELFPTHTIEAHA
jgi:glyoxylase-like metal-dependent hydrolase (beta-lactamase superfamily II)